MKLRVKKLALQNKCCFENRVLTERNALNLIVTAFNEYLLFAMLFAFLLKKDQFYNGITSLKLKERRILDIRNKSRLPSAIFNHKE